MQNRPDINNNNNIQPGVSFNQQGSSAPHPDNNLTEAQKEAHRKKCAEEERLREEERYNRFLNGLLTTRYPSDRRRIDKKDGGIGALEAGKPINFKEAGEYIFQGVGISVDAKGNIRLTHNPILDIKGEKQIPDHSKLIGFMAAEGCTVLKIDWNEIPDDVRTKLTLERFLALLSEAGKYGMGVAISDKVKDLLTELPNDEREKAYDAMNRVNHSKGMVDNLTAFSKPKTQENLTEVITTSAKIDQKEIEQGGEVVKCYDVATKDQVNTYLASQLGNEIEAAQKVSASINQEIVDIQKGLTELEKGMQQSMQALQNPNNIPQNPFRFYNTWAGKKWMNNMPALGQQKEAQQDVASRLVELDLLRKKTKHYRVDLTTAIEKKCVVLKEKLTALQENIQSKSGPHTQKMQQEITSLKNQIDAAKGRNDVLKQQEKTLKQQINNLKASAPVVAPQATFPTRKTRSSVERPANKMR